MIGFLFRFKKIILILKKKRKKERKKIILMKNNWIVNWFLNIERWRKMLKLLMIIFFELMSFLKKEKVTEIRLEAEGHLEQI